MKFKKVAAASLLAASMSGSVLAAPPDCVDRPTPPPCAADGHAIARPATFGVYPTRWRRWPLENLDQTQAGQVQPAQSQPIEGIPWGETPSPADEDRKAPPPSTPRVDDQQLRVPQGSAGPEAGGAGPPVPPQPPTMDFNPPGNREPSGIMRRLPDYEPKAPSPKGVESLGPTSDLDPPPALPFGPQLQLMPPIREAQQAPAAPIRQAAPAKVAPASDDPPPSLPSALARLSN